MKRIISILGIVTLALVMVFASSCNKEALTIDGSNEKLYTITASKAGKELMCMSGGLAVAEGEEVVISSELEKGSIEILLIGEAEEQTIDEIPDMDGEPVITFNATGSESMSGTVPAGYYLVKATVTDKATGTITIEVKQ